VLCFVNNGLADKTSTEPGLRIKHNRPTAPTTHACSMPISLETQLPRTEKDATLVVKERFMYANE